MLAGKNNKCDISVTTSSTKRKYQKKNNFTIQDSSGSKIRAEVPTNTISTDAVPFLFLNSFLQNKGSWQEVSYNSVYY